MRRITDQEGHAPTLSLPLLALVWLVFLWPSFAQSFVPAKNLQVKVDSFIEAVKSDK